MKRKIFVISILAGLFVIFVGAGEKKPEFKFKQQIYFNMSDLYCPYPDSSGKTPPCIDKKGKFLPSVLKKFFQKGQFVSCKQNDDGHGGTFETCTVHYTYMDEKGFLIGTYLEMTVIQKDPDQGVIIFNW